MTGRPKYRVDEQVFIDSGEKIISAFVHYVREENDGFSQGEPAYQQNNFAVLDNNGPLPF